MEVRKGREREKRKHMRRDNWEKECARKLLERRRGEGKREREL